MDTNFWIFIRALILYFFSCNYLFLGRFLGVKFVLFRRFGRFLAGFVAALNSHNLNHK